MNTIALDDYSMLIDIYVKQYNLNNEVTFTSIIDEMHYNNVLDNKFNKYYYPKINKSSLTRYFKKFIESPNGKIYYHKSDSLYERKYEKHNIVIENTNILGKQIEIASRCIT